MGVFEAYINGSLFEYSESLEELLRMLYTQSHAVHDQMSEV